MTQKKFEMMVENDLYKHFVQVFDYRKTNQGKSWKEVEWMKPQKLILAAPLAKKASPSWWLCSLWWRCFCYVFRGIFSKSSIVVIFHILRLDQFTVQYSNNSCRDEKSTKNSHCFSEDLKVLKLFTWEQKTKWKSMEW
jgi:hypothetical protein